MEHLSSPITLGSKRRNSSTLHSPLREFKKQARVGSVANDADVTSNNSATPKGISIGHHDNTAEAEYSEADNNSVTFEIADRQDTVESTNVASDTGNFNVLDTMSAPPPPFDEEDKLSYFDGIGLGRPPRLVARTSNTLHPKVGADSNWPQPRKEMRVIGQHQILTKWNSQVRRSIINALQGCDWSYFYPIRIGFIDGHNREHFPVVLLVGVDGQSLEEEDAFSFASACKNVLLQSGIDDVEVELQDACVARLASHRAALEDAIDRKYWDFIKMGALDTPAAAINEATLGLRSMIGCHVVQVSDHPKGGTMGLSIQLGEDDSKSYGIVTRHVALAGKVAWDHDYNILPGDDQDSHHALAYSRDSERGAQEQIQIQIADLEHMFIRPLLKRMSPSGCSDEVEARHEQAQCLATYACKLKGVLKEMQENIGEMLLGRIIASPKISEHPDHHFVRDWALVQLENWQTNGNYTNKIYIGRAATSQVIHRPLTGLDENDAPSLAKNIDEEGFLPIKGIRPYTQNHKAFRVGHRGRTSGLRFGLVAEIDAVTRQPLIDGTEFISIAQLVISYTYKTSGEGNREFSSGGDSGSCLFDFSGRAVGVLDAGQKSNILRGQTNATEDEDIEERHRIINELEEKHTCDVTFSTPIEWVLQDIEEFTGQKPHILIG